jgi:hypothetical protein
MRPIDAASRWARVWHKAWEARDTEAIVALYTPDARFSTHAFRAPYRGPDGVRTYLAQAFDEEREPRVWVGTPIKGYTGLDFATEPNFDLGYFIPTTDGWSGGDRELICYAIRLDGSLVSQSIRAAQ